MKRLEELGISPTPWNILYGEFPAECGGGMYVDGIVERNGCTRVDRYVVIADARLIAAAPELYECLRDAIESYCDGCNDFIGRDQKCEPCECKARKWRAVLAKAAGEGVKIVNKVNRRKK